MIEARGSENVDWSKHYEINSWKKDYLVLQCSNQM